MAFEVGVASNFHGALHACVERRALDIFLGATIQIDLFMARARTRCRNHVTSCICQFSKSLEMDEKSPLLLSSAGNEGDGRPPPYEEPAALGTNKIN